MSDKFEDLTRAARSLESEIDEKLNDLSNTCKRKKTRSKLSWTSDNYPLTVNDQKVQTDSTEIRRLIKELEDLNAKLEALSFNANDVQCNTLRMHRELLDNYRSEFNTMLGYYLTEREKEEKQISRNLDPLRSSLNRRTELQLSEHEHLLSSGRMIADNIQLAIETRESLVSQRHSMRQFQGRLHEVANRFPLVNNIVMRINLRRRRDSIIIGSLLFIFTISCLSYIFF